MPNDSRADEMMVVSNVHLADCGYRLDRLGRSINRVLVQDDPQWIPALGLEYRDDLWEVG
jgi:hypothetical protein